MSAGGSDGGGDTGWRKGSEAGVERRAGLQTGWTDCKAQGLRPDFGAGIKTGGRAEKVPGP